MRISKSTRTSVKATKKIKASLVNGLNSKVIYEDAGIKVTLTGRDYDFIAVIENDTDTDFCVNIYDSSYTDSEDCNVVVPAHDWVGVPADGEGYDIVNYFKSLGGVTACGSIQSSKKLSANDKALQHITAAIDILGKSGKKDDVTKDIIANLAVVAMDIKASKR